MKEIKTVMTNLCALLVAIVVMVGCTEKRRVDALDGEWSVVSVGELAVPDSVGAFLCFDVSEQLVGGYVGCNHLTGTLLAEGDADAPLFGALGSTRMWCADMTVENALLPALAHVANFVVDGTNLSLLDASGAPIVVLVKR